MSIMEKNYFVINSSMSVYQCWMRKWMRTKAIPWHIKYTHQLRTAQLLWDKYNLHILQSIKAKTTNSHCLFNYYLTRFQKTFRCKELLKCVHSKCCNILSHFVFLKNSEVLYKIPFIHDKVFIFNKGRKMSRYKVAVIIKDTNKYCPKSGFLRRKLPGIPVLVW